MSKLSFVKYQGAGNDFILIDDRTPFFHPSLVPSLCHRKFGIGADGVILLQHDPSADFRMRIYNSDGSEAETCGNGLRCLARFIVDLGMPEKKYTIATGNQVVTAGFVGNQVAVHIRRPGMANNQFCGDPVFSNVKRQYNAPQNETFCGDPEANVKRLYIWGREVFWLDVGVPHAVLFVDDVHAVDVQNEGGKLRWHEAFQPRGTNVNFASRREDGTLAVRTFERGVEAETMACGTGAVAVGMVASQKGAKNPIHLCFPGGQIDLYVEESQIVVIGPAQRVFEGELDPIFSKDES